MKRLILVLCVLMVAAGSAQIITSYPRMKTRYVWSDTVRIDSAGVLYFWDSTVADSHVGSMGWVKAYVDSVTLTDNAAAWGDSVEAIVGDKAAWQMRTVQIRIQDTLVNVTEDGGNLYLFTLPSSDTIDVTWCKVLLESLSVTGTGNDAAFAFSVGDSNATGNGTLAGGEVTWIASTAANTIAAYAFTSASQQGTNLWNALGYGKGWSAVSTAGKVYFNWGGTGAADGRIGIRARVWFGGRSTKIGAW